MDAGSMTKLSADLLVEILARLDGPALACAACACDDFRAAAKEEALWERLCHGAWPSTREPKAKRLVTSMPGAFARLHADSLPLLLYMPWPERRQLHGGAVQPPPSPASLDLISFVDVYYKAKCVLSKVVIGLPPHESPSSSGSRLPFKLCVDGLLGDAEKGVCPSFTLEPKEEGGVGVLSWALEEDLTLSWVLVDVERGRAVNLSVGKPSAVLRSHISGRLDVTVLFGCAVPVERRLLACGVAECVVSMTCRLPHSEDSLSCTAMQLHVADGEGAHLDGLRSMAVLERALCSRARTLNREAAEDGYRAYLKHRRERQGRLEEGLIGKVFALSCGALVLGLRKMML